MLANLLQSFWGTQLQALESEHQDFKTFQLPLARIKKVMKTDEEAQHMVLSLYNIFVALCTCIDDQ